MSASTGCTRAAGFEKPPVWRMFAESFRSAAGACIADRRGSTKANRRAICDRERDPWAFAVRTKRSAAGARTSADHCTSRLAAGNTDDNLSKIGTRARDPLCVGALARAHLLLPGRTDRDRQQRSRTGVTSGSAWTQKLFIRRIGLRRRARGGDLQLDRFREAERPRSRSLFA